MDLCLQLSCRPSNSYVEAVTRMRPYLGVECLGGNWVK